MRRDLVITKSNTHFQVTSCLRLYANIVQKVFWIKQPCILFRKFSSMQIYDTCVVPVLKYKRSDDETSLRVKLNKFNIHSIRKKSDRLTSYFKILTGVEPQVL